LNRARTKMANKCAVLSGRLPACEASQADCSVLRP
jgi:hypothetical protein